MENRAKRRLIWSHLDQEESETDFSSDPQTIPFRSYYGKVPPKCLELLYKKISSYREIGENKSIEILILPQKYVRKETEKLVDN